MKKSAAILFLTLFLFNWIGYKCWFHYLQQKEDRSLEASLDKDEYNEKDLITIKVPLSIPYQTAWSDFERVDGEFTFNGTIYKYVKRKVEEGQLILLCLPHYQKMKLVKASSEFGNRGNDLIPIGKKGHSAPPAGKNGPNEYEKNIGWFIKCPTESLTKLPAVFLLSPLPDGFPGFPGKPPRLS